jgi:membrane protein insertase Oxa1/YidC/SpoIIIJ
MMSIFMSAMMGIVVYTCNSAIGLYLLTTSCFSIVQYTIQYWAVIKTKWNAKF